MLENLKLGKLLLRCVLRSPEPGVTRGQQTAWIVGTLALMSAGWLYRDTRLPDGDPVKKCQGIIMMDTACAASVYADQMMGGAALGADETEMPAEQAMPPGQAPTDDELAAAAADTANAAETAADAK